MRKRQKGLECIVEGCTNWRTGNDLCGNHNMSVRRYGSVNGKPKVKLVCNNESCGKEFEHKYTTTKYCEECRQTINRLSNYKAVKKHRIKNIDKCRERDSLGKRTKRRFKTIEKCVINKCNKLGERHHPDYNKPYEIVWLCRQHHKDAHSRKGKYEFSQDDIRCDEQWKEAHTQNIKQCQLVYT